MLTYFPSPYPSEWWYSVLCRYHVRSGHAKQQTTVQELFGCPRVALGSVFPNSTIRHICSQLPPEIFPVKEIILHHTLFPFYTRCQPLAVKDKMLAKLCRGEMTTITSIRRFAEKNVWRPRYCPCCAAEEQERMGEPYWHVDHQIPLMTHCPAHKCRLIPVEELPIGQMDYTFFPLSSFDLAPPTQQPENDPEWQLALSRILYEYQVLPYIDGTPAGYSNLAITLSNMGYGSTQKVSQHTLLNAKKVYHDMVDTFGDSTMTKLFGGVKGLCIINRMCKWAVAAPERYALLQCFANLDSATMFSKVRVEDQLESKLRSLQQSEVIYTKKQVQEQLGVTASQLDILARKYGIQPFWRRIGEDGEGQHKLNLVLNDEEYQVYQAVRNASGYRFDRHFVKHCVLAYITGHNKGRPA